MASEILTYIPAQLYESPKNTYVGYYVIDPTTGKKRRVRIKLNRIKNRQERRKYARQLIVEINQKLASGWNPFLEQEAPKSFTLLTEALETFLNAKQKELRPRTYTSYKSDANIFINWIKQQHKTFYVVNFSDTDAIDFMNYFYFERNVSERRYNNMLTFLVSVWEWFIEFKYSKRNIFKSIKKKKEQRKTRQIIPLDVIDKIKDYLKKNDENFYFVMLLTLHCLLRPNEIVQLKPKFFKQNILHLPADISKNNKDRIISLTKEIKEAMKLINFWEIPANHFVVSKKFKPGQIQIRPNEIAKYWAKLRIELDLPKEYQFYSLKDTGIVNMIRSGISLEAVRDQAGHSSLEMTNKYVQIARTEADEQILNKVNF
jgi:integrase